MSFDTKRKRCTTDNFLNLVPPVPSKFRFTDGREKSFPMDLPLSSTTKNFKMQALITTPNVFANKNLDSRKTILANLTLNEKIELKKLESNRNSHSSECCNLEETSYEIIMNKAQNLMKQINENKTKIILQLEKNVKISGLLTEVEELENVYRELYRKKIIYKNDRDFQTNQIFENFQKKINDLNMNPLKQQYNLLIKEEKKVGVAITEALNNEIKITTQIQQNNNLLSTIQENLVEFEKKIDEKTEVILEEIILTKTKFQETFKNMFETRLLKEQITILKSIPKTFCVIKPKNLAKKNIFNYESYLKISKSNKFLSLFPNEKFLLNPSKTVPKLITEENFRTPLKEKMVLEASDDEQHPLKKCMSESDTKFMKNKPNFQKKPIVNQGSYKFDLIIDNQYNNFYFLDDYCRKLYFELEINLKGSFIRNWDYLLKNVSFNSVDYDFFLNLTNNFHSYKSIEADEILNKLRNEMNKRMDIENNECEANNFKKEKQEYIEKHLNENYYFQNQKKGKSLFNLPATNIIFIGDKNRGTLLEFLPIMFEDLINFENKIIKVGAIKYSFDFGDAPQKFTSSKFEEMFSELKTISIEKLQEKKLFILNLFFEIHHKNDLESVLDLKRVSLLLISLDLMENSDVFLKQLVTVLAKEKSSVQKDKNIELIENLFKHNAKLVVVNEFPNLLKNNRKSVSKFDKIQKILEFSKKLTNN